LGFFFVATLWQHRGPLPGSQPDRNRLDLNRLRFNALAAHDLSAKPTPARVTSGPVILRIKR